VVGNIKMRSVDGFPACSQFYGFPSVLWCGVTGRHLVSVPHISKNFSTGTDRRRGPRGNWPIHVFLESGI